MLGVCHLMAQQIAYIADIMHNPLLEGVPDTIKICSRKLASSVSSCCSIASVQCALASGSVTCSSFCSCPTTSGTTSKLLRISNAIQEEPVTRSVITWAGISPAGMCRQVSVAYCSKVCSCSVILACRILYRSAVPCMWNTAHMSPLHVEPAGACDLL